MRNIVITGASGFIGNAMAKRFVENGDRVIAVVRNKNKLKLESPLLIPVECDMNNYGTELAEKVRTVISEPIDLFYSFAWQGTSGFERSDIQVQRNNVSCVLNSMHACKQLGCTRFIYPSSTLTEEIRQRRETGHRYIKDYPYGFAKGMADDLLFGMAEQNGIEYISVMISNIFGPGEDSPRLINSTLRKIKNREKLEFTEGTQNIDFIYIDDAVEMMFLIGEKGKAGKRYYIGSEFRGKFSLRKYIEWIRKMIAPDCKMDFGTIPYDGFSMDYKGVDALSVLKEIGYATKISFGEGIVRTYSWICSSEADNV